MELDRPFAQTGEREDFDENTSPDGDMSLEKGFTTLFELKPEEGGLFILRRKFNQLLYLMSKEIIDNKSNSAKLTGNQTNIVVTVGSGGDCPTINSALEYLSSFYPLYKSNGVSATIQLLAGFVMQEQVLVRGIDLGWITIVGVDTETSITHTALTTDFTLADYGSSSYPAFGVSKGGVLPRIGQLFNMNLGISGAGSNKHGVMTIGAGSSADILSGKGVKNAGAIGVCASTSSTIKAPGANASGAGQYGILAETATINAQDANASGAGQYGILAQSGSTINAQGANASGAGQYGILAETGSTINAYSAIIQNQKTGTSCIAVSNGSTIEASNINQTGSTVPIFNQAINTLTGNGIIYQ